MFICQASKDAGGAHSAVWALEAAGLPCWIAPRDIHPGENYTQAILEALDTAPAIVLVFSAATNESPHVSRELEIAVGSGRRIVPMRLELVEPSGPLRYFIGTSQWLDASGAVDEWAPTLVRAVRRAVGSPDAGTMPAPPPATTSSATPVPAGESRARPAWLLGALAGAGLVAAAIIAVVFAVELTGGNSGKDSAAQDSGSDPSSTARANSAETPESSGDSGPVTCWDHSTARDAAHCPVPTGRTGMATMFPGLNADCTQVESPIEGKAEVYECEHDGFLVRFTRWEEGFDKEAYYSVENQVASQPWDIAGEPAGLQWFSIVDDDPSETQPFQWSAAYDSLPFSVSVEGDSAADRSAGVSSLKPAPASEVGLE